ncbi:hypothetical protein MRB53_019501 [Persea americana]|uniref:Uncharacterized protein n=1 Tax=Persea americana TaxID=3435 RepID=A0ACC2KY99_PERAE|nr:hypothetical protein MRB53_019501 [Persea americana]
MTKLLTKTPTELDLDSFLQSHTTSSSEDEDDNHTDRTTRRTVDEILNDSDSSSSSSSSSNNPIPRFRPLLPPNPLPKHENQIPNDESSTSVPQKSTQIDDDSNERRISPFSRRKPGEFPSNMFSSARSSSRSLPSLLGGIKPNPKPGAALAAAAAASRSIPTPHAAAIKFRRASSKIASGRDSADSEMGVDDGDGFERLGLARDDDSVVVGSEIGQLDEEKLEGENYKGEIAPSSRSEVGEVAESSHGSDEFHSVQEMQIKQAEAPRVEEEDLVDSKLFVSTAVVEQQFSSEGDNAREVDLNHTHSGSTDVAEKDDNDSGEKDENSALLGSVTNLNEKNIPSSPQNENASIVDENPVLPILEKYDLDKIMPTDNNDGEVSHADDIASSRSHADDIASSRSDVAELLEDLSIQLDSKKASKKIAKKLRSSSKPLELAEELEKKYASSGLHWEEGAAAQPMRLEGIRRGPPAVGYLQVDPENAMTRTISSQTFRREHGSPQVLAVHLNYIAVGMSRGAVVVVPSKYSIHRADSMDGKMSMLGSQGEKSHSPVTSMCFNQQGDLLLAGYGDGHLTLWDVPKATVVKTVVGEHTAPVVHTLFLGQDSQATRQFKVVTGDSKGLVLLHAVSVVRVLNIFTFKTQCLLDGQRTGTVLSSSPLLADAFYDSSLTSVQGSATSSPSGLGGMVGGVVGGVVGGETGWKLFSEGSTLVEEGVVIFVTHQTALVVRLTPSLEVYAQLSKPDGVREGSMPYTAWKCVPHLHGSFAGEPLPAEASDKASLLAIAWDRKVLVAKLVKSDLKVYKEWALDSAATGVAWLDDRMLVVLTLRGQLFLFAKEGTEFHRTSFIVDGSVGDDIITYHTHFTNIYGNPEKAFHNSVAVRGATIYILGPMHLVVSRLLPWKERIQVLQKAGDWMGALDMAMRLYDGHAHGVIDLPRTIDAIREAIMQYLLDLLLSYVDVVFSYISVAFCNQIGREEQVDVPKIERSSLHSDIQEQYARVGGVAVEFCVHIKRTDILFDEIFSKFVAVQQGGTFLELLEPYILKDMLGCLPPEIMQALVEHYSSKGWLQRVEQCVLHMDISSLDFNQVVKLCREHGLYGALIYLFNRGLDDFKTPLEELLVVLQNNQKMSAIVIGYRMLVYLKYCFMGLAFPPGHGTIPSSRLPLLRVELLQFLLEDSNTLNSEAVTRFKSSSGSCPNLCYLLWLDTEASLEVLKCAFFEEEKSKSNHSVNGPLDAGIEENSKHDITNPESQNLMAQNTVNTLIHILDMDTSEVVGSSGMDDGESSEMWPSRKDTGHILEFIAFFIAKGNATVTKTVLNRILEYLTDTDLSPSVPSQKGEITRRREKQVLALLEVLPETDWDSSYLLHLCETAQFYQVCGFIHTIRGQYLAALDSYMKDVGEPLHAFVFINNMLIQWRDTESSAFKAAVISRIPELVNLSREGTVFLIIDQFSKESDHILSELQSHPKSLFLYLKTVIEVHLSGTLNFSSLERGDALDVTYAKQMKDQSDEHKAYMERVSNFPKLLRHNSIHVTDEMAELYLELLCQYESNSVLKFLETFENYRVEHCLRLCQEYGITDAAAFLLERVGDVGSALSLILSGLTEKLHILDIAIESTISKITSSSFMEMEQFNTILRMKEASTVRDLLHASIGLCQRNTARLDPQESESLWFRLLDSFCEPLRDFYVIKKVSERRNGRALARWRTSNSEKGAHILKRLLSRFIQEIVEGMVGYVPLPAIMAKLLSDNGSQEFGDFKLTILGMLGTYGYERTILDTAKSLIEDDTYYTMSLLKKGACHAYSPRNGSCCICGSSFSKDSSAISIRVFNCGHATHLQCEFHDNEGSVRDYSAGCPICTPKKKTSRARGKTILLENGLVKNSLSRTQQPQGINAVHNIHESDVVELPYGLHQMSRFEILSNLGKSQKSIQIDTLPQLRLAPPAIYHDKVKKGSDLLTGESSSATMTSEKPSKIRQTREPKPKGSSIRFPLKSSIFNTERRRK